MKILHVNAGAETGGGRIHIITLLSKLSTQGNELLVFEEGVIAQEAREIGIKVHVLDQKNKFDLTILSNLKEFIKKNDFDIVHTHGARANLYYRLIKRGLQTKWLVTVHSDPFLDFMNSGVIGKIFTQLNVSVLKQCDHIIAVSSQIKKLIETKVSIDKDITVVHNGIKFPSSLNKKNKKVENEQFTLTYVARLHPIKRHKYLLDILHESNIGKYKLNIIGGGSLYEELEQYIAEIKMTNNVIMHGELSQKKMMEILDKTDISILASLSETFPLVLLESASRKVPFITTDVGDVRDIAPENKYSWIVPVDDKEAFKDAVSEAKAEWEKNLLVKKGEKLFEYTSKRFTLEIMGRDTMNVYKRMLENKTF